LEEIVAASVSNTEIKAVGIRCTDHATFLYPHNLVPTSPTSGFRSVGIIRSRTQTQSLVFSLVSVKVNRQQILQAIK
jgi:hypothetical protein